MGALTVIAACVLAVAASDLRPSAAWSAPETISGPYAHLLAASTDLGESHAQTIQLTAALRGSSRPDRLIRWGADNGLAVRWRAGDSWAIVHGPPASVGAAFDVAVHDYRGRQGQVFYASPQQPAVPVALRDSVSELGRILSYTPHHSALPPVLPLDVPRPGLEPASLRTTYNVAPLTEAGYTGKGTTIVVFAFDGFNQDDLDMFAETFDLPQFTPEVVGDMPTERSGEASMDLQVAHAIAPDARKVLVNARTTVEGGGTYEKIAQLMESVDDRFPGAVWTLSIGWGCDKLITAADLVPVREAIADAQTSGTTVFDASGDLAGLECKGGRDWAAPPGPADIGLDAIASLPEVTNVGGTTLTTDADFRWLGEHAWFDAPLTLGSGGGVSNLFERPPWQANIAPPQNPQRRLVPDVAAVADSDTGIVIVLRQQQLLGGGTSQAAPLWAGITAVMNQFLLANGGRPPGNLNAVLYRLAGGAARPGFRDVTQGANAVALSGPGYDMVTGLGTPDVDNLVRNVLDLQRGRL
jgi:kumamolisin